MTSSGAIYRVRERRPMSARTRAPQIPGPMNGYLEAAEAAVAEPYRGVTATGVAEPGLFTLAPTGVSTAPLREAAEAALAALSPEQRTVASYPVDSDVWRRWSNVHPFVMRHGAAFDTMTDRQREAALALLRAGLSEAGYASARDVMRLNETIGEITGKFDEYGEWLYWLSLMGTPSTDQPWGWQIDGHHLIINCLVVGDQLVMTPTFMGSEPVLARTGRYAGTRVFQAEEEGGLALMRSLDGAQRAAALLSNDLPGEVFTTAFRDNFELTYAGVRFDALSGVQQQRLIELIAVYTDRIRPGHAAVWLEEVKRHLGQTWFGWMGGFAPESVFYYRIHSPVILIEFDHVRGVALDVDAPTRDHIHTVVRTPNGNDYGKDLLRQHYERAHEGGR